jgi:hypothetical protein
MGGEGRRPLHDGVAVDWSRDWDDSLNPDVMRRVVDLLTAR